MKRKGYLMNELKGYLNSLNDYIENFDRLADWKIEKLVNEVHGFFDGYRFALRHYDHEIIRTKKELAEHHILNQTYPEFHGLWERFEEKAHELKKMMLLNDEDEAWYIAEDEKEKLRKSRIQKN